MVRKNHRLGLFLVVGSTIAWSTAGFFTRLVDLDSWTMLAWRGLFGAIGMLFVLCIFEGSNLLTRFRQMNLASWAFTIVSTICMLCFITSLRHTSVAHVAIIYAAVPFVAAALAWLMIGEKPSSSAIAASFLALLGVGIMVGLSSDGSILGDTLALGMTVSMAIMMVIARRHDDIPVMPAAFLSALLSGLISWPFGEPLSVTSHDVVVLMLFGLVNSAVGLTLFTLGARLLPAVETALIGALDAPLAPLWVWIAFAETPSWATISGGSIVFMAVTLHIFFQSRAARPAKNTPMPIIGRFTDS